MSDLAAQEFAKAVEGELARLASIRSHLATAIDQIGKGAGKVAERNRAISEINDAIAVISNFEGFVRGLQMRFDVEADNARAATSTVGRVATSRREFIKAAAANTIGALAAVGIVDGVDHLTAAQTDDRSASSHTGAAAPQRSDRAPSAAEIRILVDVDGRLASGVDEDAGVDGQSLLDTAELLQRDTDSPSVKSVSGQLAAAFRAGDFDGPASWLADAIDGMESEASRSRLVDGD